MLRKFVLGFVLTISSLGLVACSNDESKSLYAMRGVSAPSAFCAADPRSVAEAEKIPDIDLGNGCFVHNAWSATALGGVALDGPKTFNFNIVYTASKWMTEVVQPAAAANFGSRVVRIDVPSAFACRPRRDERFQTPTE